MRYLAIFMAIVLGCFACHWLLQLVQAPPTRPIRLTWFSWLMEITTYLSAGVATVGLVCGFIGAFVLLTGTPQDLNAEAIQSEDQAEKLLRCLLAVGMFIDTLCIVSVLFRVAFICAWFY
jgi:hypothetical protein